LETRVQGDETPVKIPSRIVAISLATALVAFTSGCATLKSEAWKAGHSFGSKLSSESYMEAFAGCQFAQPQVFQVTTNSEYEDFMDGCTSAALGE
jgi:hypothetical protein